MRTRATLAGIALWAGTLVPLGAAPGVACAGEQDRAALVVDTGSQVLRYCVALDEESVSGIELIVLAGRQHGLDYRLGFGGAAVCMLAGVGATGDDCFEAYPNFWGYWRGGDSGGWAWAGSGAGSTSVADGDVEGWSWGSGDDGDSHPAPPPTHHEDVCRPLPKPPKPPENAAKPRAGDGGGEVAAAPESPAPASEPESQPARRAPGRRAPRRDRPSPAAAGVARPSDDPGSSSTTSPATEPLAARAPPGDGPPAAGLGALAAAALLAAGAIMRARKKGSG